MENYIMINGKKIELTRDQVAQLCGNNTLDMTPTETHVKERFNPAKRKGGQPYYAAGLAGVTDAGIDASGSADDMLYGCANYWNDKAFAKHVSLSMLLYRKLLQYAYLNDLMDDKPWDGEAEHFVIGQPVAGPFMTATCSGKMPCTVYFKNEAAANKAVENVVEPFMEEHPDFRAIW